MSFLLCPFVAHWNKMTHLDDSTLLQTHTLIAANVCNAIKSFFYFSGWRPRRPLHHWRVPSWRAGPRPHWHFRHIHPFFSSQKKAPKHTRATTLSPSRKHPRNRSMKIKYFTFALRPHALTGCNCTPVCSLSRWWKAPSPPSGTRESQRCQTVKHIGPLRRAHAAEIYSPTQPLILNKIMHTNLYVRSCPVIMFFILLQSTCLQLARCFLGKLCGRLTSFWLILLGWKELSHRKA